MHCLSLPRRRRVDRPVPSTCYTGCALRFIHQVRDNNSCCLLPRVSTSPNEWSASCWEMSIPNTPPVWPGTGSKCIRFDLNRRHVTQTYIMYMNFSIQLQVEDPAPHFNMLIKRVVASDRFSSAVLIPPITPTRLLPMSSWKISWVRKYKSRQNFPLIRFFPGW